MPPGRRTVLVLVAAVGCAFHPPHVPVDPDVTFAAHEEHGRVVVDRLPGNGAAVATPPGGLRRPRGARFVLRRDGGRTSSRRDGGATDRKRTRLHARHVAVFCTVFCVIT